MVTPRHPRQPCAFLVGAFGAAVLTACTGTPSDTVADPPPRADSEEPSAGTRSDPSLTPAFSAPLDVGEVLTGQAFEAGGLDQVDGDTVLVVHTGAASVEAGDSVQVTGKVRPFNAGTFEDQLGVDLDEDALDRWDGRPAVLALDVSGGGGR